MYDSIGPLVSPVCNYWWAYHLWVDQLFESVLPLSLPLKLSNLVQARDSWHEAEEGIDGHSHSRLSHEDTGLVAVKNLQTHSLELGIRDWSIVVEEFWISPDLLQVSLPESSLEDDVEDALDDWVFSIHEFRVEQCLRFRPLLDLDLARLAFKRRLNLHVISNRL